MSQLKDTLERKAKQIGEDPIRMESVRDWIDGFWGKIINFKTPNESYHLVFTKEKVDLREGSYPSCEVHYRGDENAMLKILSGERAASASVKTGALKMWGSLNEATRFEGIL